MYSFKVGIWKTIKNLVIVMWPFILGYIAQLPLEYQTQYAPVISFVSYLIKNYLENR